MKPKVYVLDRFYPSGPDLLEQHADVVRWDDPEVSRWPEDADAIMVRLYRVTGEQLADATRLRVIAKQGVGTENIDLAAAKELGITVCNSPGVNAEAVAEHALVMGLAVGRRLCELDRTLRAGLPVDRSDFLGIGFLNKTIGVVGMGHIGSRLAQKWRAAFDTSLIAYDPYAPSDAWPDLPHARVDSLAELLPHVDVLSLHVPLTPETRNLIGSAELGLMHPSAILVNVSRGGIVDERALYEAISEGRLFGAGIDAFEIDPPPPTHPLLGLDRVIATPHSGAGTVENQANTSLVTVRQLLNVLAGGEPDHRVV